MFNIYYNIIIYIYYIYIINYDQLINRNHCRLLLLNQKYLLLVAKIENSYGTKMFDIENKK